MIYVIGSGPTGVAAAKALTKLGREVTILDAGVTLEPERKQRVNAMAMQTPSEWSAENVAEVKRQMPATLGGVPLKFTYGSDFPYQEVERFVPFENVGTATRPTLARGGFSAVWGAVVLPYLDEDLRDWPVAARDLERHYRAVTGWMPLSAQSDDLEAVFPLYCDSPQHLARSEQIETLLADLAKARPRLNRGGFRFGQSRLAVRAQPKGDLPGCIYCAMCLSSCPYGLIYDASATLSELLASPLVRYVPDVVVERLDESGERVTIRCVHRHSSESIQFDAERVYVACGAVGTTRLLLQSLEALDHPLEMKDSQYFLLPWLRGRGLSRPRDEALHTLCQAFVELNDPSVEHHNVHLQVYGFSDVFVALFDRLLGPLSRPARPLVDALLSRLLLIQGYLHSSISPTIRVTLRPSSGRPILTLEQQHNPATLPALRRVGARLLRHTFDFKALPLYPLLQVAPAGRGFHSGGTFPMREAPGPFECDVLGRPHGFSRVHVVDSTTFPTVPSTTITFTAMANAHRIGSSIVDL
ncbi:MAG: GMC oxidoreductase [Myxococcota bacterium]